MSGDTVFNAAPMPYLKGINDRSRRENTRDPEQLPTHLPHYFIWAEEGPSEPTYIGNTAIDTVYGLKTMDSRYPYYNHQSLFLSTTLGEGNGCFVQRLLPTDVGPKARILLSADVLPSKIKQYERDVNNKFKLDASGQKIPITGPGAEVDGHKVKWVVNSWGTGGTSEAFGNVSTRVGSMTDGSDQSTLYPIMEFEVSFHGEYGNNIAIRLVTPTIGGTEALNGDAAAAIKSFIYRMYLLRRNGPDVNPNVVRTTAGDVSVDFSLRPDAIDLRRNFDYSFDDAIVNAYQDLSAPGMETPIYGPFGRQFLYRDNLEAILEMLGAEEAQYGTLPVSDIAAEPDYLYSINPFTAINYDAVPYFSVELETVANGNQRFSENSQVYGAGASDGTMTNATFDALVRNELENYGETEYPLLDWAKYPLSAYYDSGFSLDTKFAFAVPMSKRKDLAVVITTHVDGEPQLTAAEESSMAMTLNNFFRNYPESTIFGTPTVRCLIVGCSGKLVNGAYRKFAPVSLELNKKFSAYMGAGTGFWRSTAAFDVFPNNQLTMFDVTTVNTRWKPAVTRYRDWDNGLIWPETFDRKSLFFPGIQTVYNDDTSILNAAANMWIAVDLEKVALRSWRVLSGNSKLSDDQFLERSDEEITNDVRGKYDSRAVVRPKTYYTSADKRRGYSWSCDIDFFGNNMKTAGQFTINADRLSALTAAEQTP